MARPHLDIESWGTIRRTTIDGKPTAVAYYRDATGKRRKMQRQGRTGAEAGRILLRAMKAALSEADGDLTPESTVQQAGDAWTREPEFAALSEQTRRTYQRIYTRLIVGGFGNVRLREATVPRVDRFSKRITSENGPAAARSARSVLNHVFSLAVRHGAMQTNPVPLLGKVSTERKPVEAPSIADIRALRWIMWAYDTTPDGRGAQRVAELSDVFDMLTATGARPGEILALSWDDIDFAGGTVAIAKTVIVGTDGKLGTQEHPKTDAGRRVLTLPRYAVDMLTRRRVDAYSEWVFPSSTGTLRWPHNLRRQWREAVSGTPYESVTPRSIRKAVATLIRDEMGVQAAQEQLGHASSVVTTRHYVQPLAQAPDVSGTLAGWIESSE